MESVVFIGVVAIVVVGVSVGVCTRFFRSVRAAKSELVRSVSCAEHKTVSG